MQSFCMETEVLSRFCTYLALASCGHTLIKRCCVVPQKETDSLRTMYWQAVVTASLLKLGAGCVHHTTPHLHNNSLISTLESTKPTVDQLSKV